MDVVNIVKLPEMKMASFHAIGEKPEIIAFAKLQEWAFPRGIFDEPGKYRVFGFNNPPPEPGRKEYGYEFLVEIGKDIDTEDIKILELPSKTYAMMHSEGFENTGPDWQKLMDWITTSKDYESDEGQCLEGHIPGCKYTKDDFRLDIYEPVRRKSLH